MRSIILGLAFLLSLTLVAPSTVGQALLSVPRRVDHRKKPFCLASANFDDNLRGCGAGSIFKIFGQSCRA